MYLRRNRRTIRGETYEYWTLVESVRTASGPRQQVVASLGKEPSLDESLEAGWEEVDALLAGAPPKRQLELGQPKPPERKWRQVDVGGVRVERTREFGEVYLALSLWRRLKLGELLEKLLPAGREWVAWEKVASVLTVARFCGQLSELGVAERWYGRTALEDLLGVKLEQINDDRLYRGLDQLLEQKDALCGHLMERYRSWFGVRFEFLIYDVTSTYFEGQMLGNAKAARGHSRDHRPDCKQVCIGLVVSPEGLPLAYEVFGGNRTDVTTVKEMVTMLEKKYGQAQRIWVMDRGMVSEENLKFLRERGAEYVVGTPKSDLRRFEQSLVERTGWAAVRPDVEVKLAASPEGGAAEQYVLCRSASRREKEKAMLERQHDRLWVELLKIDVGLREHPQEKIAKVERRIGRWLGRYPAAAAQFQVEVDVDSEDHACGLTVLCRLDRGQWARLAQGAYLLRTNATEKDPVKLWDWYLQLQQAESAFRASKSDLHLRPIFHHRTERAEAHILVCFLALALWRTLEQWMKAKGLGTCARQLVGEIATIGSMDVVMPVRTVDNEDQTSVTELRLRVVAKPERMVAELLQRLGIQLPSRSRTVENVVEKSGL